MSNRLIFLHKPLIIWFFFSLLLSGCGFRLRGSIAVPAWFNNIKVETHSANPDLLSQLISELRTYDIFVVNETSSASYILVIEKDLTQRQLTSVSASTTPRQYQLYYTVWYSLITAKGQPLISSDSITLTRQLTINNDRVLGSDFEDSTIHREMRREAAMRILSHLSKKATSLNVN